MTKLSNRDVFIRTLNALGSKDFDTFESFLTDDHLAEWPYVVMQGFPTAMSGGRRLREMLEVSLAAFAPFRYEIIEIHECAKPDRLLAEYSATSRYLTRDVPYANQYVGVIDFRGGKISRWREYVNPMPVLEALGPGLVWTEAAGQVKASSP